MDEEAKTVIVACRFVSYKCPWCGHERKRDNSKREYFVHDIGGCGKYICVKPELTFEDLLNGE